MSEVLAGRYELVEVVGRGSMGEVWRGLDQMLQRDVAVKIVGGARQADPVALQRFQREAVAMANLFHPNVVSVYDVGAEGDRSFLVMELLSGPSVARLIADEGQLAVDRVVHIGAQVARGLSAAHAIGVTHRDIKPGNIVMHHKVTKIVDFGIARLENFSHATLTSPAMAIGTAAYMSPEQARGKAVQPPSDLYSLACLMTAMLTGKPPFVNGDPIEVARAHAMDQPPRAEDSRPEVPTELADLIDRMLAKRPADRPTAPEVAVQLSLIESSLLGLVDPSSPYSPLAPTGGELPPSATRGPGVLPTSRPGMQPAPRSQPTPGLQPTPSGPVSQATPIQPEDPPVAPTPRKRFWRRDR